nr:butyrophilin subfamily 1 member A1-like isoform X2 [Dasypus novemcinctus]
MAPPCLVGTLLLLFMVSHTRSGQFHVIGPKAPVIALVGEEAELSCHLSPMMDAQNMEVRWHRNNPFGLVHLYKNFQDHIEKQKPDYGERTEFLKDNITKGDVTLRIRHIRPSDGGEYRCLFESSSYFNEAQFQVLVTGSGTAPHIHIDHSASKGLNLTCMSMGWYPEPEVEWRDLQEQRLAPASETKTPEMNGLFRVETSVLLDESTKGNVSCSIRNPVLDVEKEVHISVSDALFPRVSPWPVAVPVIVVLLVIIGIICVPLVRARKSKGSLKKQHVLLIKKKDKINKELDRRPFLGEEGLNKVRRFAEDIKLDKATAHPYLSVSADEKYVITVPEKQDVPDIPERFDTLLAVLGQNSFCGGNHYWEVQVAGNSRWTVGLCWDSINRKGHYISACPENGFWTICLKKGVDRALSTPRYTLNVPEPLLTVGIFLKYEEGLIFFYNVTDCIILYIFKSNFTKPMRPYFYPGHFIEENPNGLTITKVPKTNPPTLPRAEFRSIPMKAIPEVQDNRYSSSRTLKATECED